MASTIEQRILEHWTRREAVEALELCTSAYRRRILSFLTKKLDDAEDAREAFAIYEAALWESLTHDPPPPELTRWLYRLASNIRRRKLRSAVRRSARFDPRDHDTLPQESSETLPRQLEGAERRARFERLREQLNDDERELLALLSDRELPPREVAEILGITWDALRTRLHRVTTKLKQLHARVHDLDAAP